MNGSKAEKSVGKVIVDLKVRFTFWEALKIRLSGAFKNAESYEQKGEVIKITYAKK